MAEGLFCGLPRRYVFIGFDLFLLLVILLYAMMPSDSKLGPTAGYSTPDGRWVTETTAAANAVGPDPKPWQNPAAKWRRKRHLRKHLARYAVEQEEAMWNATWDGETRRGIKRRRLKRGRKGTLGGRGGEESDDGTAIGSSSAPEASSEACSSPPSVPCSAKGRALVTLSLAGTKKRDHFTVTRVPMEAYAQAVRHFRTQQEDQLLISRYPPLHASFHVVDSFDHPALAKWNSTLRAGSSSHFIKLPMMQYFLEHYSKVLFVDDDILISPFAPDLFETVPCHKLGATVEAVHTQGWHAMHGRALCELYNLKEELPAVCSKERVKSIR
ncbi:MAG: hypothetical protein SGPRY_011021, partial [Prymnesium sp.]